jgi:hypothetical protein
MKPFITLIVFFSAFTLVFPLLGQFYIAGDTTLYHSWPIGQTYTPNDTVEFDIDCDGLADLSFISIDGNAPGFPWDRLTMVLGEGVEVCNSGTGFVTGFEVGDTIPYDNAYWTSNLDFIYGTGVMGAYGQANINNKYLSFRKSGVDTVYAFIRFSNQGLVFTIHEILSSCGQSPLISAVSDWVDKVPTVFPNPCYDQCYIQNSSGIKYIEIFDAEGKCLFTGSENSFYLTSCSSGLYLVKIVDLNGSTIVYKLVKY